MDLANLGAKRIMVVTDGNVRRIKEEGGGGGGPVDIVIRAIEREMEGLEGMGYEVFDRVAVEPKDTS